MSEDSTSDLTGIFTPEELKTKGLNVSGKEPIDGWISVEKGTVLDYSLKFDEYIVNYDKETREPIVIKNGELDKKPIMPIIANVFDNVKYYEALWVKNNPIYYNPIDGIACKPEDYKEANSTTSYNGANPGENQTSCLKWYAYSEENGNVNMILDHNVTDNVEWVTEKDYSDQSLIEKLDITYTTGLTDNSYYYHDKGPLSVLNALYIKTDNWINTPNQPQTNNYSVEISTAKYTINYTNHKARLISAEEIAKITNNRTWIVSDETNDYFFDSNSNVLIANASTPSSYSWLFDNSGNETPTCLDYGCSTIYSIKDTNSEYTWGYWTSSPHTQTEHVARRIVYGGNSTFNYIGNKTEGARPVITVPATSIY